MNDGNERYDDGHEKYHWLNGKTLKFMKSKFEKN